MSSRAANRAAACAAALLAACAGAAPEPAPAAVRSVPLTAEQVQICREFETAYRAGDPQYEALRDRAAADPATAVWLTRMLVRDVIATREGRELAEHENPDARADARAETRALAELQLLGAAAVPTLVGDLLCHAQPQLRDLGVELLARVGPPAVTAVVPLASSDDPRRRRAVGRTLGAIGGVDDAMPTLRRLATDDDFAVRADALRELHDGGAAARALLVERLRDDDDAFVRRIAAESLRHYPDRASAAALVDYLARCRKDGDVRGEMTAQESLQVLAGARGPRTEAAWRAWVDALTESRD